MPDLPPISTPRVPMYVNNQMTMEWQAFFRDIVTAINGSGVGGLTITVTGTAPIQSSGGVNPDISIVPATSSVPGYMTVAQVAQLNAAVSKSLTSFPYVIGWVDIGLSDISGLTVTFPAIKCIFPTKEVVLSSWSHTFTQGTNYSVWVDSDGVITYDEHNLDGTHDRFPDKCYLCQVLTWATTSVNTGIWTVWSMCDRNPVEKRNRLIDVGMDSLINDYYVKPHDHEWAGSLDMAYQEVVRTSAGRLYICLNPGPIHATEPPAPAITWEPYAYSGFQEFKWGATDDDLTVLRYIGRDTYEGAFRQGVIAGVHNVFGLISAAYLARCPREISSPLAEPLWNYVKNAINRAVVVWQGSHAYKYGQLVTGDFNFEGWVWQAQNDGTSAAAPVGFEVSPPPTPGISLYIDNDITWKCVGRTSYHNPDVNWTIMDTDTLMEQVTTPDSHDGGVLGLVALVDQLLQSGYLPDGFFNDNCEHGITYFTALYNIVYFNIISQFEAFDLYPAHQFYLIADGNQTEYPFFLLMDVCGGWYTLSALVRIMSDPSSSSSPAEIAYVEAFRDSCLEGVNKFWDDTSKCFTWVLDENGDQIPAYDPALVEVDNVAGYPWVMAQYFPILNGIPVGSYKTTNAALWAETIFPYWWKLCSESAPFLLGDHHLGLLIGDFTDMRRREVINMVEESKMDYVSNSLVNTKWFHNLAIYLYITKSLVLRPLDSSPMAR